MRVIINPGTGIVARATKKQADKNMSEFVREVGLKNVKTGVGTENRDGRWNYVLSLGLRRCDVDMPGVILPEDYMSGPRLYVEGCSWWWPYAVSIARGVLSGVDDEEVE